MTLRPADLGDDFARQIITHRLPPVDPFLVRLFRFLYGRRTGLKPETTRAILEDVKSPTVTSSLFQKSILRSIMLLIGMILGLIVVRFVSGLQSDQAIIAVLVANGMLFCLAMCGFLIKESSDGLQPLFFAFNSSVGKANRADFYQARAHSPEYAFGLLVNDVSQMSNVLPAAEEPLRDAVRLFGESLSRLSAIVPVTGMSAAEHCRAMRAIRDHADYESDSVVRDARLAQADAHEKAANAAFRNETQARRIAALRDTLTVQIEALRQELPAFQNGGVGIENLAAITESVHAVAAEVTSAATARAEVNAVLTAGAGGR